MPAGLLGAGLLLCVEGGQVNRKGTAGGKQGGAALPGRCTCLQGTQIQQGVTGLRLKPTEWAGLF